jgi:hypothetical protein
MLIDIEITEFRPLVRGALRGFVTLRVPEWGIRIHDCTVCVSGDAAWVSPPGRSSVDSGGTALRGDDGKIKYAQTVSFDSRERRSSFSDAAIAALLAKFPRALD